MGRELIDEWLTHKGGSATMERPKISKEAMAMLDKKLARARAFMIEVMVAGESGTATIGYGPQGLRFASESNESPEKVNTTPEEERMLALAGHPRRNRL